MVVNDCFSCPKRVEPGEGQSGSLGTSRLLMPYHCYQISPLGIRNSKEDEEHELPTHKLPSKEEIMTIFPKTILSQT